MAFHLNAIIHWCWINPFLFQFHSNRDKREREKESNKERKKERKGLVWSHSMFPSGPTMQFLQSFPFNSVIPPPCFFLTDLIEILTNSVPVHLTETETNPSATWRRLRPQWMPANTPPFPRNLDPPPGSVPNAIQFHTGSGPHWLNGSPNPSMQVESSCLAGR